MGSGRTWLPSHLCLICTSSTSLKPSIPVTGASSNNNGGDNKTFQIKCEPVSDNLDVNPERNNENYADSDKLRDTGPVNEHVKAVFVLRKLLNYPEKGCIKYLQLYGVNPGNWFTLCSSCNQKIAECYRLYRQLQQLEHKWAEVKEKLKNEIYNGQDKLFNDCPRRNKTKHLWQDVRDFVYGKQKQTHIAPVQKSTPKPEQSKLIENPYSMFNNNNVADYCNAKDYILPDPDPLEPNQDGQSQESDWEPEPISEEPEPDDVAVASDLQTDSNMHMELDESKDEVKVEPETSPRKSKRKASVTLNNFNSSAQKTPRKETVEPNPYVSNDPVENPHIPLAPRRTRKCPLCVGFYYHSHKFDKHVVLHETQGGIPCEYCGWYHKPESMRFHVNHFHNPVKPRVLNEVKKKRKSKEANVEIDEDEDMNKDDYDDNNSTITNQQNEASPIKRTKKKWKPKKKQEEEIVYYCDHCDMKTLHRGQIILHFEAYHTGKEMVSCTICNENFVSSQLLEFHSNLAHPSKLLNTEENVEKDDPTSSVHICTHCEEVFSSTIKLDYHILKCHKNVKWTCHCGYRTGQNTSWKAHCLTHTGENPFACHFCDKVYRSNISLKYHMRQVHFKELGIESLKCSMCEASCLNSHALRIHMEVTHGNQKTHCCDICGKMFGTKPNLKAHVKTHENDNSSKPGHYSYVDGIYTCTFCEVSYTQNKNIVKHLRKVHPEQCDFKCTGCETQFCSKQGLRKHQSLCEPYRQTLPEQTMFKCKECAQVFTVKNHLLGHRKKVHSKYECDACGHKMNSENMMVRHKSKCFGVKLSRYSKTKAKKTKMAATAKSNDLESDV